MADYFSVIQYEYHNPTPPQRSWRKLIAIATAVTSIPILYSTRSYISLYLKRKALKKIQETKEDLSTGARGVFREAPYNPIGQPDPTHSHGHSAHRRSNARRHMVSVVLTAGKKPHHIQPAKADVRDGNTCSGLPYHAKDLGTEFVNKPKPADSTTIMTDVDYYVDLPRYLAANSGDVLLYSIIPEAAGYSGEDYSYHFENDEMHWKVSGGGNYSHKLWRHPDTASVSGWKFGLGWTTGKFLVPYPWIQYSLKMYNVEKLRIDHSRFIVGYFAFAKLTNFWAFVYGIIGKHEWVERLSPNVGDYTAIRVFGDHEGLSIGLKGIPHSVSVTPDEEATITALATRCIESKSKFHQGSLGSCLNAGSRDRRADANILHGWFVRSLKMPVTVYAPQRRIHRRELNNYTFGQFSETDKPTAKEFGSPIYPGATAPLKSKGNEQRSINKRVLKVLNTVSPSNTVLNAMNAFLDRLIPENEMHKMLPCDFEEVEEKQNRPTQRALRTQDEFSVHVLDETIKTFMKAETAGKFGDPRNISTIPTRYKTEYSRYCYAATKYLKKFSCYASSKPPSELAEQVTRVCQGAAFVNAGDFSRMDGHECEPGRVLFIAFMCRLFDPVHFKDLMALLRKQFGCHAIGKFGTMFDTWLSRLSGSPETSLANTLINMFIAFLARYLTLQDPTSEELDTIFRKTMDFDAFCGDDSLMREVSIDTYSKAARLCGHKVTSDIFENGSTGVNFLARIYSPYVWNGSTSSMCSPKRTFIKFFTAVHLVNDKEETHVNKLVEKATSIYHGDSKTPVIGYLARAVLRIASSNGTPEIGATGDTSYLFRTYAAGYPQEHADDGWMHEQIELELPGFDIKSFEAEVDSCRFLSSFLNMKACYNDVQEPLEVKSLLFNNGDLVSDEPVEDHPNPVPGFTPFDHTKYVDKKGRLKPQETKQTFTIRVLEPSAPPAPPMDAALKDKKLPEPQDAKKPPTKGGTKPPTKGGTKQPTWQKVEKKIKGKTPKKRSKYSKHNKKTLKGRTPPVKCTKPPVKPSSETPTVTPSSSETKTQH